MLMMIVGLVLFLGAHSVPIVPGLKDALLARVGPRVYRIAFSIASIVGVVAIVRGYVLWKYVEGAPWLYVPPIGLRHLTLALMAISFVLFAASHGKSHIRKWAKHPMLAGVKLWAFAHLLANGNLASVVLFGAFLAWAVLGRISAKRRERAGLLVPPDFTPTVRSDVIAVVAGLILYVLFVWKLHLWLIGVSPVAM
ncbi:MAG: NnrU family protein [Acuticoccus sp.]